MYIIAQTHTCWLLLMFGLSAVTNFTPGLTVAVWTVSTHHCVTLILRRSVKEPDGDEHFCPKKMNVQFSSSCLSPHQLQDGYSNNNGNGGSQQCVSQPATPGGALPVSSPLSPSPASLSSYHGDDSDSISSPPWPLKTPSSPVRTRNSNWWSHINIHIFCNYLTKEKTDCSLYRFSRYSRYRYSIYVYIEYIANTVWELSFINTCQVQDMNGMWWKKQLYHSACLEYIIY